ncbi:protein nemuri-like isoform X2 [Ostrea edulis]|uniref:protein nemuri-like isoform X2 n=1 Tax=Ostrea edulis TaxID=37623 RepID=UPI0020959E63|nr:protein nemuri-like isoform X2 [Ostrea edulis]
MVSIRILLLFTILLIGIFLQKSSSKSIDESNHHVESSSDLEGDHELIRSKRDIDSTIADMTESERAMGDSALSNEDETQEIEKRGRRRRRGGRRRSRRRRSGRRGSRRGGSRRTGSGKGSAALGALDAISNGLGAVDAGLGIAQTVGDMNQGNDDNGGDY